MSELVSCIVPVHNGEAHLDAALTSLERQDWPNIEIIVVNDGSRDASLQIARRHAPAVSVISHAGSNPVLSRNLGIANARGAFLCFLDQDDLSVPQRISAQMAALRERPGEDVCVGMVQRVGPTSTLDRLEPVGTAVPGYLTIAMLARRRAFDVVGLLDPHYFYSDSAEWFLRARTARIGVSLLQEVVTYHREHTSNRSRTHANESRHEFLTLVKRKLDHERGGR